MRVVLTRKRTRWYIRLVAANGETVAVTQHYYSRSNAVRAASDIVQSAHTESWVLVADA